MKVIASFKTYAYFMVEVLREKGRNLTPSYDKKPYIHRKIQNAT